MIHGRFRPPRGQQITNFGPHTLRDRLFVWKLLAGLAGGLVACLLVFLLPAIFFIEQNYKIFTTLAFDVNPTLVHYLEREIIWLRSFLIMGTLATGLVAAFFARRIVRHLIHPLENLEDHLHQLTQGDWTNNFVESSKEETYRTLFLTYGYFHRSLKNQAAEDLKLLEKILVDPSNREAVLALEAVKLHQRMRLGAKISTETDASSAEVVPIRRAS